jgi:hypothetical protein
MTLAMIEACEHVLGTAKRLLCFAPGARLHMVRIARASGVQARRTESLDEGDRPRSEADAWPWGQVGETVEYESGW